MPDTKSDPLSPPPSYDASFVDSDSSNQNLSLDIITARNTHLRSTVTNHIIPRLRRRAREGIHQTTFALIPSYISTDKPDVTIASVSDFAFGDTEFDEHLVLKDTMDSVRFWTQAAVVRDFEKILRDELNGAKEGRTPTTKSDNGMDKASGGSYPMQDARSPAPIVSPRPTMERTSWSTRFFSSSRSMTKPKSTTLSSSTSPDPTRSEAFKLQVELDEICSRTLSPFGLYETVTRPAIIVKIEVLH